MASAATFIDAGLDTTICRTRLHRRPAPAEEIDRPMQGPDVGPAVVSPTNDLKCVGHDTGSVLVAPFVAKWIARLQTVPFETCLSTDQACAGRRVLPYEPAQSTGRSLTHFCRQVQDHEVRAAMAYYTLGGGGVPENLRRPNERGKGGAARSGASHGDGACDARCIAKHVEVASK